MPEQLNPGSQTTAALQRAGTNRTSLILVLPWSRMDGLDDVSNRFYDHALICQIGIILVAPPNPRI